VTLEEIINTDAAYCRDVTVTICRKLPSVTIKDGTGEQEDIYMQGDDADQFLAEFDEIVDLAPDVLFADALKYLAKPYVDCLWH
jgi:hypothetical protein